MIATALMSLGSIDYMLVVMALSTSLARKVESIRSGGNPSLTKAEEMDIMNAINESTGEYAGDEYLEDMENYNDGYWNSEPPAAPVEFEHEPTAEEVATVENIDQLIKDAEEAGDTITLQRLQRLRDVLFRSGLGDSYDVEMSHIYSTTGINQAAIARLRVMAAINEDFAPDETQEISGNLKGKAYALNMLSAANAANPKNPCEWLNDRLKKLQTEGNDEVFKSNVLGVAGQLFVPNESAIKDLTQLIRFMGCQEIGYGPYSGLPF